MWMDKPHHAGAVAGAILVAMALRTVRAKDKALWTGAGVVGVGAGRSGADVSPAVALQAGQCQHGGFAQHLQGRACIALQGGQ